jgi:hypothetical protein
MPLNTTKIPIAKKSNTESLLSKEGNLTTDSDGKKDYPPLFTI